MSERKTSSGEYLDPRAFGELLDLNRESIYRAISRGARTRADGGWRGLAGRVEPPAPGPTEAGLMATALANANLANRARVSTLLRSIL